MLYVGMSEYKVILNHKKIIEIIILIIVSVSEHSRKHNIYIVIINIIRIHNQCLFIPFNIDLPPPIIDNL
jgi:hypothetical protein